MRGLHENHPSHKEARARVIADRESPLNKLRDACRSLAPRPDLALGDELESRGSVAACNELGRIGELCALFALGSAAASAIVPRGSLDSWHGEPAPAPAPAPAPTAGAADRIAALEAELATVQRASSEIATAQAHKLDELRTRLARSERSSTGTIEVLLALKRMRRQIERRRGDAGVLLDDVSAQLHVAMQTLVRAQAASAESSPVRASEVEPQLLRAIARANSKLASGAVESHVFTPTKAARPKPQSQSENSATQTNRSFSYR